MECWLKQHLSACLKQAISLIRMLPWASSEATFIGFACDHCLLLLDRIAIHMPLAGNYVTESAVSLEGSITISCQNLYGVSYHATPIQWMNLSTTFCRGVTMSHVVYKHADARDGRLHCNHTPVCKHNTSQLGYLVKFDERVVSAVLFKNAWAESAAHHCSQAIVFESRGCNSTDWKSIDVSKCSAVCISWQHLHHERLSCLSCIDCHPHPVEHWFSSFRLPVTISSKASSQLVWFKALPMQSTLTYHWHCLFIALIFYKVNRQFHMLSYLSGSKTQLHWSEGCLLMYRLCPTSHRVNSKRVKICSCHLNSFWESWKLKLYI